VGAWEEGRSATRAGLALDPQGVLNATPGPAWLAWMESRYEDALDHLQVFVSAARQRHDLQGETLALSLLADYLLQLDRAAEAEAPARDVAEVTQASWRNTLGDLAVLAETLVLLQAPDAEANLARAEQLIEQFEKWVARPQILRAKGRLLLQHGDFASAIVALHASAAIARSQHAVIQLGRTLAVLAEAARKVNDEALGAQAETERADIVERIGPEVRRLAWARDVPRAHHRLRGRARSARMQPATILTRREREVAALVAQKLTDRKIAEQLVITEGTAGVHVSHILNKLGFHTRAEIANWAVQHGIGPNPHSQTRSDE
jgi:DNA-binding NarL/FixJ family response regulator